MICQPKRNTYGGGKIWSAGVKAKNEKVLQTRVYYI